MSGGIDPGQHLWWLASRSVGVVAMLLVSLSVAFGLAMSGRAFHGRALVRVKTMHEALALSGLFAIALHGLLLLPDAFLRPGLAGISVPFVLSTNRFWNALGVAAGWLAAAVTLSFYVRPWIGVRAWRLLHRWTLAVYVLGLLHAIGAGTDAGSAWLLAMLAITGLPVVLAGAWTIHTRGFRPLPVRPRRDRGSHAPVGGFPAWSDGGSSGAGATRTRSRLPTR
jgi:sulfoxide reductase heme-binding subunit YedZ